MKSPVAFLVVVSAAYLAAIRFSIFSYASIWERKIAERLPTCHVTDTFTQHAAGEKSSKSQAGPARRAPPSDSQLPNAHTTSAAPKNEAPNAQTPFHCHRLHAKPANLGWEAGARTDSDLTSTAFLSRSERTAYNRIVPSPGSVRRPPGRQIVIIFISQEYSGCVHL